MVAVTPKHSPLSSSLKGELFSSSNSMLEQACKLHALSLVYAGQRFTREASDVPTTVIPFVAIRERHLDRLAGLGALLTDGADQRIEFWAEYKPAKADLIRLIAAVPLVEFLHEIDPDSLGDCVKAVAQMENHQDHRLPSEVQKLFPNEQALATVSRLTIEAPALLERRDLFELEVEAEELPVEKRHISPSRRLGPAIQELRESQAKRRAFLALESLGAASVAFPRQERATRYCKRGFERFQKEALPSIIRRVFEISSRIEGLLETAAPEDRKPAAIWKALEFVQSHDMPRLVRSAASLAGPADRSEAVLAMVGAVEDFSRAAVSLNHHAHDVMAFHGRDASGEPLTSVLRDVAASAKAIIQKTRQELARCLPAVYEP